MSGFEEFADMPRLFDNRAAQPRADLAALSSAIRAVKDNPRGGECRGQ